MKRRRSALLAAAIFVGVGTAAAAQSYPARPVTMVVPFPRGETPTSWRALQSELS
jgi:tripartite-type tricarboxylate transporter receptor subunit TctC